MRIFYKEEYRNKDKIYYKLSFIKLLHRLRLVRLFSHIVKISYWEWNCKHNDTYWRDEKVYCVKCGKRIKNKEYTS